MKRILSILILFFALVPIASGQSLTWDENTYHWEMDFSVGLNNDGHQFDLGIAYFPVQYFGIKLMGGAAGEFETIKYWIDDNYLEDNPDCVIRCKFTPSFVLRSPQLLKWKQQDAGFYLFAEPGLILAPGASGSQNAQWLNKSLLIGINMQLERGVFYIGYGITDFSLYSGFHSWDYGNPPSNNYTTHSVFIGAAYKF